MPLHLYVYAYIYLYLYLYVYVMANQYEWKMLMEHFYWHHQMWHNENRHFSETQHLSAPSHCEPFHSNS